MIDSRALDNELAQFCLDWFPEAVDANCSYYTQAATTVRFMWFSTSVAIVYTHSFSSHLWDISFFTGLFLPRGQVSPV